MGADMSQEKNTIEEYDAILKELRELMIAKNTDYGDSWREMRLPSITDQILVKAYRIRSMEESEGPPKVSEGIESPGAASAAFLRCSEAGIDFG